MGTAGNNDHSQDHRHHAHTHGVVDPLMATSKRGVWAVKWSFVGLMMTAFLQIAVVVLSNSVALLADTIHNIGDAFTAVPLAVAFMFARLTPTKRFTYGWGRVEDVAVVLTILASAFVAGYEAVDRFFHPAEISYVWAVIAASVVGFLGNEAVALFRIKVGKQIGSAALVADGYHARVDGWTSLSVLVGAIGVWIGFPLADPLVGIGITIAILFIVWESGKSIVARLLDGIETGLFDEILHATQHIKGVKSVGAARARWLGHRLRVEINVAVDSHLSVTEGHAIATEVRHQLLHKFENLGDVLVHVDPEDLAGEEHHRIHEHTHDGLERHSH
ncbi:MAG: cation transporter [Ignavibacteria bacterium]|nr:cation transporter [Ignavibacteria bacterium]